MDKYAIFLDFDSTLSKHNTVSEENCKTLKKVQELGHYVFISTGRNYQGIEPIASKFHNFSGYVSGLGSHIIMGDTVIHENFFSISDTRKSVEWFLENRIPAIITCVNRGYCVNPTKDLLKDFTEIPSLEFFDENCKNEQFQKIESHKIDWTEAELEFWDKLGQYFIHVGYTECCPKGSSKSSAIKIVSDYLGIDIKNTIAIGDSANDIEMISFAGIGVAMGDAPDFVKECADFITTSYEEHGVSYALKKLILNNTAL